MDRKPIIIRKYENRRLYDATNSRYVNLDDIATMVREGAELQVVDARTGDDLTRLVLTQIIAEHAREREFALPQDVLRQLVIASGKASQEALAAYVKSVIDWYQSAYRAFATPSTPFDLMRALMTPAAAPAWFGFGAPAAPQANEGQAENGSAREGQSEVNELKRRVEELERRLAAARTSPRPAATKRRR